ncbi:hypothetical protein GRX01_01710 [Halobaculum sp. WSA2]|uniref:Uncharacterized protein n=1 Tax=Halobaculum saliterrae TaxID=2073113 RepID=A0A6B0SNV9_9EURY|nr:hypothetical protein [Halobaculum saliterrae]MXR40077.1 hypothetical protein [Halobaculum saliterrae]
MIFVDGFGEVDAEYFQTLTNTIEDLAEWDVKQDSRLSQEDAAETASEGRISELDYVHNSTDSILRTMMPSEEWDAALTGRLRQTVIPEPHSNRMPAEDSFESQLSKVYNAIAEQHTESEYLSTASGDNLNYDLLSLNVPWDYDEQSLESAFEEMGAAAEEAYRINESVRQPVQSYLE